MTETTGPWFAVPGVRLGSAAAGMSPIGLLIAGPLSDKFGIQTWFLLGGSICLLMAGAGFLIPALKNMDSEHQTISQIPANEISELSLGD